MATIRICNVEGCQRKHEARGYCQMHYNATPARRAAQARYEATPAGKVTKARYNAARERAKGLYGTPQALGGRPVPDIPRSTLEAHQRALMRAYIAAAEWTTWGGCQYLVDLLCEAEGVQVLRSSDSIANAGV